MLNRIVFYKASLLSRIRHDIEFSFIQIVNHYCLNAIIMLYREKKRSLLC